MKEIILDGKKAFVEVIKGVTWVHYEGQTYSVEPKGKRRDRKEAVQEPDKILAPMPGKILEIPKKVGDAVSDGDVLVIMEAMKMEYTLKAIAGGKVSEINCTNGDQVQLGDVLVRLDVESKE